MKGICKEEIKGRSERNFVPRVEKEHHFVRKFPGYAHSSFS
jgi:antibiotic biosynthesis monooxygenase (ABM) superfamily enzyme